MGLAKEDPLLDTGHMVINMRNAKGIREKRSGKVPATRFCNVTKKVYIALWWSFLVAADLLHININSGIKTNTSSTMWHLLQSSRIKLQSSEAVLHYRLIQWALYQNG